MLSPWLRKLLCMSSNEPVTHLDVEPAPRDPEAERKILKIQGKLAREMVGMRQASREVRQELASNVVRIVAGNL